MIYYWCKEQRDEDSRLRQRESNSSQRTLL